MTKIMLSLFILLCLMPKAVRAAEAAGKAPAAPQKNVKVVYKKTEKHEFSGAQLKGRLKKPELSYIYERKGLKEEQIVNIPENFNNEINDGAGQL